MINTHQCKELLIAIEAAKMGAKTALKFYDKPLNITFKADNSPVTIADRESEKTIKKYISSQLPESKFLAEETGGNINEEELWIIDPVDGTRSFTRGIPFWCVLISYYKNKQVLVSVCYFPLLDLLITAEKDKGAFCNNTPLSVSKISELHKSIVSHSSPKYFKNKTNLLKLIEKSAVSRNPDPTYAAYLVAAGKYDVLVDANAKTWDAAPLKLIIEEAGGKFTDMEGKPWDLTKIGYIVSNNILHDETIQILRNNSVVNKSPKE